MSLKMMQTQLKQKFFTFKNWVAYWDGRYGCSLPSTKVLRAEAVRCVVVEMEPQFEAAAHAA